MRRKLQAPAACDEQHLATEHLSGVLRAEDAYDTCLRTVRPPLAEVTAALLTARSASCTDQARPRTPFLVNACYISWHVNTATTTASAAGGCARVKQAVGA